MLKAAQEKEALQQERSDLLALVQKGEAEVTGLHKALADTNSSNADMAASYRLRLPSSCLVLRVLLAPPVFSKGKA